jgi:Xaa-Pro aminopeptidase
MRSFFTADFFIGNRSSLRNSVNNFPIVIAANGLLQRSGDDTYAFEQDANFWYLTGLDNPDLVLVIDEEKDYLLVPKVDSVMQIFNGAVTAEELTARSGIEIILDERSGWKILSSRLAESSNVSTLLAAPAYISFYGMYTNPARARLIKKLKRLNPKHELLDVRKQLAELRTTKQPAELMAMQRAIDITVEAIEKVSQKFKSGKYKYAYEIEADLTHEFRLSGSSGHAFAPIVAVGAGACTIHNLKNDAALLANEFVLLDIGAQVEHYPADISRTMIINKPSKRQQAIYDAVIKVQNYAYSILKPGASIRSYELKVESFMGECLLELGIIKEANRETIRSFFPHATFHFVGLNVHDVGDYRAPLQPGAVLAVEPGIYVPEEGIGVRVEDNVLITEDGINVLTTSLPSTLS